MRLIESKPKRRNRTVVLHLGNTLAEYEASLLTPNSVPTLIQRVEVADSLNWEHLADGHQEKCPRQLHFTHQDAYTWMIKHFDGTQSVVTIFECGVWSVRRSLRFCPRLWCATSVTTRTRLRS